MIESVDHHPWLDHPETDPDRDALRRAGFARTIYDLIASGLPGESIRIGVYGAWGEGKSTVLYFISRFCRDAKIPVVWFNPWTAKDAASLWRLFSREVRRELHARRSWKEWAAEYTLRVLCLSDWSLRLIAKWQPWVAELLPLQRAADVAAKSLAQKLPALDQAGVHRFLRKLPPHRRLVVMIDDLDRADPAIVPHLLLALCEIFDVRSCAFIIALDPRILAKAFPQVHPGWGATGEFIEKIIQFPFWLPPPSIADSLRLAEVSLERLPLTIDRDAVRDLGDLVPSNPRRLKQYFRNVLRLRATIERHDPDELKWTLLLLIELMRAIAPLAAIHLFRSSSFLKNLALVTVLPKDKNDDYIKGLAAKLEEELGAVHALVDSPASVRSELHAVVTAFTARAGLIDEEGLKYWARLDDEPPIFTWREFRQLFSAWRISCSPETLSSLAAEHARVVAVGQEVVLRDLFNTCVLYRQSLLDRAADVDLESEQAGLLLDAGNALQLLEQLTLASVGQAPLRLRREDFHRLYEHAARWAHFTNSEIYRQARAAEERLLLDLARDAEAFAAEELETLGIWNLSQIPGNGPEARGLHDVVSAALTTFVLTDLRRRFNRDNGIGSLWGRERALVHKYILFRADSGFYSDETREDLKRLADQAATNGMVQNNFLEFLRLLTFGLRETLGVLTREEILPLARNRDIIGLAWRGATAQRLQPRTQGSLAESREVLKRAASGAEHLPLPRWWSAASPAPETDPVANRGIDTSPEPTT